MIEQSPILITGVPRSGASMIASVINMCGAFGGNMSKRGMFGNDKIREEIVDPYFKELGADLLGQYPLPSINDLSIPTAWRSRVEQIMYIEGFKTGPWMYKDARLSLMWPVWNYAFPNAKWIIVRRRTGDIINSCLHTGFMKAFSSPENQKAVRVNTKEEGWLWWVHQYEERFVEMITEGVNCKVIWPDRMVHGDYQQMYQTLEWLGLSWKSEVLSLIDPLLWHTRQKEKVITQK